MGPLPFCAILAILLIIPCQKIQAQNNFKLVDPSRNESNNDNLLIYNRIIRGADGSVRMDQNIVPHFRLSHWLHLELGFRQGERSGSLGAYNGYKVEFQTKALFNYVRLFARMSDKIVRFPAPSAVTTNYMMVAEARYPLNRLITATVAGGYVYTFSQKNTTDGLPVTSGLSTSSPTYKLGLHLNLQDRGFVAVYWGAFDVFNPYSLSSPFTQVSFDYDLSPRYSFYSYYRYQYDHSLDIPLNNFLCLGLRIHF